MTENQSLEHALNEKLYTAEKRISMLRMLLVAFNSLVYLLFMEVSDYPLLANCIIVFANFYAVVSWAFEPYRKYPFLSSYFFTTFSDAVLIVLWIIATGFMDSPFFVIIYISILAVAFRYSLVITAVSTAIYLLLYFGLFFFDPFSNILVEDLLVRVGYIPLAGMLGMYFSIEISDQIAGKIKIAEGENALKKAHAELEKKVAVRTAELQIINTDLTDSINYAQRIQNAILPTRAEIKSTFSEAFILHIPRDTISGDFYWFHHKEGITHIAVVDCTGHGVPGALISMIGNNLLNHSIIDLQLSDPGDILKEMDYTLAKMLKQDANGDDVNDGMDLSLCMIDHEKGMLSFAGAQNSGILYQNGEAVSLVGSKFTVGGLLAGTEKSFTTMTVPISKNDHIYMYTDGYQDQFGGDLGKKFYRKNLLKLIDSVQDKPMTAQLEVIKNTFLDWKGYLTQIDDVSVIGLKL